MSQLSERLKQCRDNLGWSQEDLARRTKIRQSFIGALETGAQQSSGYLPEIAHALGVDAYWLKTGKGEMRPGKLTNDEQSIIDGFRLLGDEMREAWLDQARKKIQAASMSAKNRAA